MRKHSPIPRALWQNSQKQTLERWKGKNLHEERKKDEKQYLSLLLKYAEGLPHDGAVLEIGCGPICLSQALPQESKTYLDPLLDDFRRRYPGELPEGEYLASFAERIPKPDNSFDLIICLNAISYSLNPELIMNEMERLLRPGGRLILAMRVHSPLESRLHYWTMHCMPSLCCGFQPNYYALKGIRKTLDRHFTILDETISGSQLGWLPLFKREDRLFVCTNPVSKTDPA